MIAFPACFGNPPYLQTGNGPERLAARLDNLVGRVSFRGGEKGHRVIAPGMPHHVTQRGNRRQQTFFGEEDYQHYLELISRFCRAEQIAIWAYCLRVETRMQLVLTAIRCSGSWTN
jgi:hypothetical protein